ncbi:MAG: dicarboxylate/amino acid:cation symporter [Bacteroidaceae bacterium]|nr:dicarboxylate/amino acid:cation symporter [Bacteroidaceae bacterium]MBQ8770414.1 dicarboxylate/amino acid:cation symporter [Bacteroides sp.]MBR4043578.1 dicarboxylate/amino acid:cation symporter [Bacteroidaceae bacterium]
MKKFFNNTIVQLLIAVVLGIVSGFYVEGSVLSAIVSLKHVSGQVIFFLVPLIILGFIAPSIAHLRSNASKMLLFAFGIAYLSSIGASFFGAAVGYQVIPHLNIASDANVLKALPENMLKIDIPPVMNVMTALVLAALIGLATAWVKSDEFSRLLDIFQKMVLELVKKILLPVLPVFIFANFCILSYQGAVTKQLPVFVSILLVVIVCHYIWLALLYGIAALYSRKNSLKVLKFYGPAYLTALGTMSSAATLGVALHCAHKSPVLRKEISDVTIPLFANIHLCGSILTETVFVMTVSQLLYGTMPDVFSLVLFILLLGLFAIGAPGVPGGTVLASLGLIISVLHFDEAGTALLLTIFALQDSFGTACNVTGDGALTLITDTYEKKIAE